MLALREKCIPFRDEKPPAGNQHMETTRVVVGFTIVFFMLLVCNPAGAKLLSFRSPSAVPMGTFSYQNAHYTLRLKQARWSHVREKPSFTRAPKQRKLSHTTYRPACCCSSSSSSGDSPVNPERQEKIMGVDLPNQGQAAVKGTEPVEILEKRQPPSDLDYLGELIAIQQNGPKQIGFFGTRNMGFAHQQLVEILSYALVSTDNHIYTSGALGTNAAVIRGALRAERQDLLTVFLPQSQGKQPEESQLLLKQVENIEERPWNDELPLYEASKLCNNEILQEVQQVICFAFHDSRLMLETCEDAKESRKIVTLFYLD